MDAEWEREGPGPRERRLDVVLGLLLAVTAVVSMELARSVGDVFEDAPGAWERAVWALAVALPLCVRRRFPVAVLVLVAAAFIGHQARLVFDPLVTSVCLYLALYTAGAWARDRRAATAVRLVVVVAMFSWLGISLSTTAWQETTQGGDGDGVLPPVTAVVLLVTVMNLAYFAAGWVVGDRAWQQARTLAELELRNRQLHEQRAENTRRAVVQERVRIARELHDVVAHHVSVMGVQAGAARRVMATRPDDAQAAISRVEASARQATDEMRRLLGVLREDVPEEHDLAPAPGTDRLPELVAGAAGTQLRADYAEVGTARPLPPALSVTLYRIVQEALTNTVRHAGARRVDVRLRWLDDAVEVEVVDDGVGATKGRDGGVGLGLVGMQERTVVHDGELEVGPRLEGGYRVRARFPVEQDAVEAVVSGLRS
ncbi:sensor histidine kinase [Aquipuribacter sp. MA13-6]|uniref:sensor histidine kinase n=1 Tax=unclassified Aquipuribacter TaxID=2635084 RepID=UPI003EE8E6AE